MKFIYSCQTDIGTTRTVNQDSLLVKYACIGNRNVLLSAVCDGVGGLSQGEAVSRKTAELLDSWFEYELLQIMGEGMREDLIQHRLSELITDINREIYYWNQRRGESGGTTLSLFLAWDYHYLIGHVGDSRIFEISRGGRQLTRDHSWVARQIELGYMTEAEAAADSRQNVILRCIGTGPEVEADIIRGEIQSPAVYVLCTDGFWHHTPIRELERCFPPGVPVSEEWLKQILYGNINRVKECGETDNITAVAIAVY
ncbi:hypothetical protein GPL15_07910 [Clostridium sp. MCC353]|uniref:PP2C family protein-serine/threonine phosphatase n=1 Tax=Clostridium sp. MCC353 TaxID=2592646 RepID=UPI001C01DB60|nr:PP2C family serine/threonine-protein phosphatase [Clostridium sp. MCC353]MBT9776427.1 hypothetical protein [Clostridium sp. MCC353]